MSRGNQHLPSRNLQKPQSTPGAQILWGILQPQSPNFAYEMVQLQMSIQDESGPSVGPNKLEDISSLINLYMIGVETLECIQDRRFKYFSKKLEALMLKRTVVMQLCKASRSPDIPRRDAQEKRNQHQAHLFYSKQQHGKARVKELVDNIDAKLHNYGGVVAQQIKTQKQGIQERLKLRKLRSQNGSVSRFDVAKLDKGQIPKLVSDNQADDFDDAPLKGLLTPQYKRFRDDANTEAKPPVQTSWRDI